MRALFDACVLYPTVLREILFGVSRAGLATPLWSARILEEWARAAARIDAGQEAVARGEIVMAGLAFPGARVALPEGAEAALDLPDANDRHVLAAAVAGQAKLIVTYNLRDFPDWALGPLGIRAVHPDLFLLELWRVAPAEVAAVVEAVRAEAQRLSGQEMAMKALLKRLQLPRLAKALSA